MAAGVGAEAAARHALAQIAQDEGIVAKVADRLREQRLRQLAARLYPTVPSCQVPTLSLIYMVAFSENQTHPYLAPEPHVGTFVEVGAYDGEFVSNTVTLADAGWHGVYIEPVPEFVQRCADRHARNPNVQVLHTAAGPEDGATVEMRVAGTLSTSNADMLALYQHMNWSKDHVTDQVVRVPSNRLDTLLELAGVQPSFDVLVIDTEGWELNVMRGFDLARWMPALAIVEIEDSAETIQTAIREGAVDQEAAERVIGSMRAVRDIFLQHGYKSVFADAINTVFVREDLQHKFAGSLPMDDL